MAIEDKWQALSTQARAHPSTRTATNGQDFPYVARTSCGNLPRVSTHLVGGDPTKYTYAHTCAYRGYTQGHSYKKTGPTTTGWLRRVYAKLCRASYVRSSPMLGRSTIGLKRGLHSNSHQPRSALVSDSGHPEELALGYDRSRPHVESLYTYVRTSSTLMGWVSHKSRATNQRVKPIRAYGKRPLVQESPQ